MHFKVCLIINTLKDSELSALLLLTKDIKLQMKWTNNSCRFHYLGWHNALSCSFVQVYENFVWGKCLKVPFQVIAKSHSKWLRTHTHTHTYTQPKHTHSKWKNAVPLTWFLGSLRRMKTRTKKHAHSEWMNAVTLTWFLGSSRMMKTRKKNNMHTLNEWTPYH